MSAKRGITTYQLVVQGDSDAIVRRLPTDSMSEAIEQAKDALDRLESRVDVKVYEENATGRFNLRELTPREASELELALEQLLESKIAVHSYGAS